MLSNLEQFGKKVWERVPQAGWMRRTESGCGHTSDYTWGVREGAPSKGAIWCRVVCSNRLGVGGDGLAVIFNMGLGGLRRVVHGVFVVTACQVRVVCRGFVFARFVVLSGLLVVARRMFVMLCCPVMMFCCLF